MNPYTVPLVAVPAAITVFASVVKARWIRRSVLLLATAVFWLILQLHVHWTFSHPFDPDDGGPKAFAFLFGWLFGIVLVITPAYWISRGIQSVWLKRRR